MHPSKRSTQCGSHGEVALDAADIDVLGWAPWRRGIFDSMEDTKRNERPGVSQRHSLLRRH